LHGSSNFGFFTGLVFQWITAPFTEFYTVLRRVNLNRQHFASKNSVDRYGICIHHGASSAP